MTSYAKLFLAVFIAAGTVPCAAGAQDYDRLKNILEEKFVPDEAAKPAPAPVTRSLSEKAPAPSPAQKTTSDFEFVKPDANALKRKRKGGSKDSWYDSIKRKVWGKSSSLSPLATPAQASPFSGAGADIASGIPTAVVHTGGGSSPAAEVPVAKKNSYMIQLKPDATETQIQDLLKKYDLKITKVIGALGVITVEQINPPELARSLENAAPQEKLESILEPPLVRSLRQEPAVGAAFVDSLIGTKGLPKPSGAEIKIGDKSYAWRWQPGETPDGNWGLKDIRVPAMWSLVQRHRAANPEGLKPKIGIIDIGFTENANVKYTLARGAYRPPLVRPDCETHHGTHIAGIIGARQGAAPGIDGIVPDADLEAVAIAAEFIGERDNLDADLSWQAQAMLFSDVLSNTMIYLTSNLQQGGNLRVLNVSLAYNFVARGVLGDADPDEVEGLKLHIADQASVIRTMARIVENQVLFVVAAGNDSEGLDTPLAARWASPFAWAGTYAWTSGEPVRNIIVVEATGRDGNRAGFSNVGGHVSAPGVDIMSTLGSTTSPFGVCSGTSQAAPHVAAVAGLLFELAPEKSPADVIAALKDSGIPAAEGETRAPRIDAIAAAAAISETARTRLADLDGNGTVDAEDVKFFVRSLSAIEAAAATEAPFTEDLNGDGVVDDNECHFPRIDLNGDGQASVREAKASRVAAVKSDVSPIEAAWSGAADALKAIFTETGLSARIAHSLVAATAETTAAPPTKCRRRDGAVIAALNLPPATGTPSATPERGVTPAVSGGPVADNGTVASTAPAEEVRIEVTKGVEDLKKANPDLKVVINPATGLPISISGFKPDATSLAAGARPAEQSEEDTRRIVETFLETSGITAALPAKGKKAELKYTGRRQDPDFPSRYIANVEQRVNGVKVFGSSARLTVENTLGVTKYQGATSAALVDKTVPDISESAATAAARKRLGELLKGSGTGAAPPLPMGPNPDTAPATAEVVVFDPALLRASVKGGSRLAWMVTIDTFKLFVDAKTGEVFHFYRDKPTGLIRRIYDYSNPAETAAVVDEDGKAASQEIPQDAEQAFRYTGAVRDFFFLVFGRNSFDDNDQDGPNGGAPLESYVRYGTVRNAYWCPSKSYYCPKPNVMVFGPGYAGAVDIVAHEMVHGIIQHESNLIYSDEPGAVNESIADIFGALIEFYAKSGSANWLLGESAPGYSMERPLRSLADPNLTSPDGTSLFDKTQAFSSANRGQPDHYGDVVTADDQICATTWLNDNGCVHFNSGILNKFAYLIAEGGEHRGTPVQPLGRQKLAHLTYRTMTANLNQTATLIEAAEGFLQSCLDLTQKKGAGFTEQDCDQVLAAQQAVGLVYKGS
jgi:Zn-dependent metalloprotease